jgi:hypothetical protein
MPQQLVSLRPAKFIQHVLMPFRDRLKKLWTLEQIEEIEADHRGYTSCTATTRTSCERPLTSTT